MDAQNNVYGTYSQEIIDEYIAWFKNIPGGVTAELRALRRDIENQEQNLQRIQQLDESLRIWFNSVPNFCRKNKMHCFRDKKTGETYINPNYFDTFLETFKDAPAFYAAISPNWIAMKQKMDSARFSMVLEGSESLAGQAGEVARQPFFEFDEQEGGAKRKRRSKSKSKKSKKSKSKSKSKKSKRTKRK